jgi:Carbohydrate phosphorylase
MTTAGCNAARARRPCTRRVIGNALDTTNLLRLWKAEATESFFQAFNVGDYYRAVDEKVISETISKVLFIRMTNLKPGSSCASHSSTSSCPARCRI